MLKCQGGSHIEKGRVGGPSAAPDAAAVESQWQTRRPSSEDRRCPDFRWLSQAGNQWCSRYMLGSCWILQCFISSFVRSLFKKDCKDQPQIRAPGICVPQYIHLEHSSLFRTWNIISFELDPQASVCLGEWFPVDASPWIPALNSLLPVLGVGLTTGKSQVGDSKIGFTTCREILYQIVSTS